MVYHALPFFWFLYTGEFCVESAIEKDGVNGKDHNEYGHDDSEYLLLNRMKWISSPLKKLQHGLSNCWDKSAKRMIEWMQWTWN